MRKYTRKDIARLVGDISYDQVRKNEKRLGLRPLPSVSKRCVRYDADEADKALVERGLVRPGTASSRPGTAA